MSQTLPVSPLATDTVEVAGQPVAIRSLSRAEAFRLRGFEGQAEEAEVYLVARGCDITDDDARAWLASVDLMTGSPLVDGILTLSGLLDPQAGSTRGRRSKGASSEP